MTTNKPIPPAQEAGEVSRSQTTPPSVRSRAMEEALEWLDRRELVFAKAPTNYASVIKAELKRLNALSLPAPDAGWRDMESAPKDGTSILWCTDRGEYMKKRYLYEVIRWPTFKECFEEGRWLPLPAPPVGDGSTPR